MLVTTRPMDEPVVLLHTPDQRILVFREGTLPPDVLERLEAVLEEV